MQYPVLTIGDDDTTPSRRSRHVRKTRAFQCLLLRAVLWSKYRSDKRWLRPVFLDFCGTESMHRAFVANLRCGRVAQMGSGSKPEGFELLRSEEYKYAPPSRCDAGVRQIVYFPQIFDVDVKGQSERIDVVAMPPRSLLGSVTQVELLAARAVLRRHNDDIAAQRQQIEAENAAVESWRRRQLPEPLDLDDAAVAEWALLSRELCVRVDSRTRYPVPPAPEFRAMLVRELTRQGVVDVATGSVLRKFKGDDRMSWRDVLDVKGPGHSWEPAVDVGYLAPVALSIEQAWLGETLAKLAKEYYKVG